MTAGPVDCELEALRAAIERALHAHLPAACVEPELIEASRYALSGPAKRVRSILLVLTSDALGGNRQGALAAASAVEYTHAASLILDDLPSMDDANERRGKPSAHVAYSEPTAVLSAIALLNQSYAVLATATGIPDAARVRCVSFLTRAVGFEGLVAGQMSDLKPDAGLGLSHIETKHFGKTGALFAASLAIGGAVAGTSEAVTEALWTAGGKLGVAFQGYDDLLDIHASTTSIGKPVGADGGKETVATALSREDGLMWCAERLEQSRAVLRSLDLGETPLSHYVAGLSARLSAPVLAKSA